MPLFICVVVTLIAVAFSYFHVFRVFEHYVFDRAFRFKPLRRIESPIVFIEIDQKSIQALGEWPWSRDFHARLVGDTGTFGARQIIFDIFFPPPVDASYTLPTFLFAQTLSLAGNAYLSINFGLSSDDNSSQPVQEVMERFARPISLTGKAQPWYGTPYPVSEQLYQSCAGAGHISVQEDSDGKIRRVPLIIQCGNLYYPQLALRAFADYMQMTMELRHNRLILENAKQRIEVPVDNHLQYTLNWRGRFNDTFRHCSYVDVLAAFEAHTNGDKRPIPVWSGDGVSQVDPFELFDGAVCFVGFTTAGLVDQKPVTISNRYPLVGIHATLFENLLHESFFRPVNPCVELFLIFLYALIMMRIVLIQSWKMSVAMGVVLGVLLHLMVAVVFVAFTVWIDPTYIYLSLLLSFITGVTYRMSRASKESRQIKKIFKRYVAPGVVDTILREPSAMELGGTVREVSILFCDIRDFTSYTECVPPDQVIAMLNAFFALSVQSIFKYRGTIDKFIGDCVLAYWGAPTAQPDHATRAVQAAIDIQRQIEQWNAQASADMQFCVGIGICSGDAIVGNIGVTEHDFQKTEYTVIGDSVNLASRITALTPPDKIYISESTHNRLGDTIASSRLPAITVKGKRDPVAIYEVLIHDR